MVHNGSLVFEPSVLSLRHVDNSLSVDSTTNSGASLQDDEGIVLSMEDLGGLCTCNSTPNNNVINLNHKWLYDGCTINCSSGTLKWSRFLCRTTRSFTSCCAHDSSDATQISDSAASLCSEPSASLLRSRLVSASWQIPTTTMSIWRELDFWASCRSQFLGGWGSNIVRVLGGGSVSIGDCRFYDFPRQVRCLLPGWFRWSRRVTLFVQLPIFQS